MTLSAEEFIRRFLLHVLPASYIRIRYCGFFSNGQRKKNIALCKKLLGISEETEETPKQTTQELMLNLTGKDITKCPRCKKGTLVTYRIIPRPQRE